MSNNRRKSKTERELCADMVNQFEKFCNTQRCSSCLLKRNILWELSEEHDLGLKCETIYATQMMENKLIDKPLQEEEPIVYTHVMYANDIFGSDMIPEYKGQLFVGIRTTECKKPSKHPEDYIWCKILLENEIFE